MVLVLVVVIVMVGDGVVVEQRAYHAKMVFDIGSGMVGETKLQVE